MPEESQSVDANADLRIRVANELIIALLDEQAAQIKHLESAILALEKKLGVDNSDDPRSIDYRMDQVEVALSRMSQ